MNRIVIDTNVIISAGLKADSEPRRVIRYVEQHGLVLKSTHTEKELFKTLAKPKLAGIMEHKFIENIKALMESAEPVTIAKRVIVCRDPNDDKFLDVAINGRADALVSGDKDLLALHPFENIPILTPADFLAKAK